MALAARLPDSARWIWVSMDHAPSAVAVRGGKVVAAPPIARWAVGKDERVAAASWRELGAVFRELPAVLVPPASHDQEQGNGRASSTPS